MDKIEMMTLVEGLENISKAWNSASKELQETIALLINLQRGGN